MSAGNLGEESGMRSHPAIYQRPDNSEGAAYFFLWMAKTMNRPFGWSREMVEISQYKRKTGRHTFR